MTRAGDKRKSFDRNANGSASGTKRWRGVAGARSTTPGRPQAIAPGMVGFMVSTTRFKEYHGARELATAVAECMEANYPTLRDDIAAALNSAKAASSESSSSSSSSESAAEAEAKVKVADTTATTADFEDKQNTESECSKKQQPASIEDQVAAELAAERAPESTKKATDPVSIVSTGHDCLRFLKINDAVADKIVPSDIARALFNGIREGKPLYTRHALRCIPFDIITNSTMDDIAAGVEKIGARGSSPLLGNGQPFSLQVKIRYCPSLNRDNLIEQVAQIFIDKAHKVNLSNPVISVVIEVFGTLAGIAIMGNSEFSMNRKFNFIELKKTMDEQKEAASTKNVPATGETSKPENTENTEDANGKSTPIPASDAGANPLL